MRTGTRVSEVDLDRYGCVIWDWNGTLLDDLWLCLEIANGMLSRRGLPTMDADRYREIFDFPVEAYYRRAGFDFEREPFPLLADEFIGEYNQRVGECLLHERARELLEILDGRGVVQAILSASRKRTLVAAVASYEIDHLFVDLAGLDNHFAESKIEVGRSLVKALPCEPDRILMIGDTTHDAAVADALGIGHLLVSRGHQGIHRLSENGSPVFTSLHDLINRAKNASSI